MWSNWLQTLHDCVNVLSQNDVAVRVDLIPPDTANCINNFQNIFVDSMSDDLHTPVVLAAISDPLKTINDLLHTRKVLCFWYTCSLAWICNFVVVICLNMVCTSWNKLIGCNIGLYFHFTYKKVLVYILAWVYCSLVLH